MIHTNLEVVEFVWDTGTCSSSQLRLFNSCVSGEDCHTTGGAINLRNGFNVGGLTPRMSRPAECWCFYGHQLD